MLCSLSDLFILVLGLLSLFALGKRLPSREKASNADRTTVVILKPHFGIHSIVDPFNNESCGTIREAVLELVNEFSCR